MILIDNKEQNQAKRIFERLLLGKSKIASIKMFGSVKIYFILLLVLGFKTLYAQSTTDTTIYQKVDTSAEFIGGRSALYEFVTDNIQITDSLVNCTAFGSFLLEFVIEKDGSISQAQVTSTTCQSLPNDYYTKKEVLKNNERIKRGQTVKSYPLSKCDEACAMASAACIKMVYRMPKWQPAIKSGVQVRMTYKLPVRIDVN